jgi:hypothetical protein
MRRESQSKAYRSDRQGRRRLRVTGRRSRAGRLAVPRWLAIAARWTIGAGAGLMLVASLHANTLASARSDRSTRFLIYAVHVGELLGEPALDGPEAACQQAIAARLQRPVANPVRWRPVRVVF